MAYEGKFSKPRNTEANIRAKAEAFGFGHIPKDSAEKIGRHILPFLL